MDNARFNIRSGAIKPITEGIINRLTPHTDRGFVVVSANWDGVVSDDATVTRIRKRIYDNWLKENDDKYNKLKDTDKEKYDSERYRLFISERNNRADSELKDLIVSSKYSFSPVYGGFRDDGKDTFERSFVIYNEPKRVKGDKGEFNFDELEDFAIYICNRFVQNCVYVQRPDELAVYVNMDGDVVSTANDNKPKINRRDEVYYTTGKRDKHNAERFTGNIDFHPIEVGKRHFTHDENICESYLRNFFYSNYNGGIYERMRRDYDGEVFLSGIRNRSDVLFDITALSESETNNTVKLIKRNITRDIENDISSLNESLGYGGGIIVLSRDVNTVPNIDGFVVERLIDLGVPFVDRGNRLYEKYGDGMVGWNVGKYFNGTYHNDKLQKTFDRNSMCVEVRNVSTQTLEKIAKRICRNFGESVVLMKNYSTDEPYIVSEK